MKKHDYKVTYQKVFTHLNGSSRIPGGNLQDHKDLFARYSFDTNKYNVRLMDGDKVIHQ